MSGTLVCTQWTASLFNGIKTPLWSFNTDLHFQAQSLRCIVNCKGLMSFCTLFSFRSKVLRVTCMQVLVARVIWWFYGNSTSGLTSPCRPPKLWREWTCVSNKHGVVFEPSTLPAQNKNKNDEMCWERLKSKPLTIVMASPLMHLLCKFLPRAHGSLSFSIVGSVLFQYIFLIAKWKLNFW